MQLGPIEISLNEKLKKQRALFIVLLDPDSSSAEQIIKSGLVAVEQGADALFLGGSFI